MRAEVRRILKAAGATAVFVTHDQAEALSLADDVGVMMDGRILQCADAQTVYRRPANPAVARFVGEANIFPGRLDDATFGCAAGRFPYTGSGAPTAMLLRPEDLEIHPDGDLHADAGTIEYYGHDVLLHGTLGDGARVLIRLLSTSGFPAPGSDLTLRVRPGVRPHFFD
jgi:iron(III) transport system ATP-binding protein